MLVYLNLLVLLLLHAALSSPLTTPSRGCSAAACKTKPSPSQTLAHPSASALAVGAACGVYTPNCAHGLRCTPPEDEARPLRALLEGRGVCSNITSGSATEQPSVRDPTPGANPDEAPCRKLLTTLILGLDAHLFKSHHDIYMPNCDRRGFFRKKQCWSSRGKQRGRCWCVDESGMPVSTNTKQKGSLSC